MRACTVILASTIAAMNLASAQTAPEWAQAANSSGCQMIVWEGLRSECISRQSDAKVNCERDDLSCRPLDAKGMLSQRDSIARNLQAAKDANSPTDVDRLERDLSTIDSQIIGVKKEAQRREEINQKCALGRRSVMETFDRAVRDVKEKRASMSNSDPAWNDLVTNQANLERSITSHIEEHDKANKRAAECRDVYY